MSGTQRDLTFRFLAEPTDVNFGGKVHGGMVMKWIDQAGYAAAVGWSGKYCVTVAVGGIEFVKPILIGDLVSVCCRLIRTGISSMQFGVTVTAQNLQSGAETRATNCVIETDSQSQQADGAAGGGAESGRLNLVVCSPDSIPT
jgi:acyl-CoA hydrolase